VQSEIFASYIGAQESDNLQVGAASTPQRRLSKLCETEYSGVRFRVGFVLAMTDCDFRKLNFGVNVLFVTAGWMALAMPSALGQAGAAATPATSATADAPYVATMTFDVASVRQNKDIDISAGFTITPGLFVPHTTAFHASNSMIENLISMAYGVWDYQIVNAPKWPYPTFFMIEAKSDSQADAKLAALTNKQQWAEQQHMVLALLEDRFKLKTHWETREGDAYNLVVAKGGPKMGAAGSIPPSAEEKKRFGDHPVPAFDQLGCDEHGCTYFAHGCSMGLLVSMLTVQFGRPVINKTGLTGNYDFVLKYKGRWDRERPADDMDPMPPMDRALQEELGLKVEPAKGPVKVLVIDHIEKPSEN